MPHCASPSDLYLLQFLLRPEGAVSKSQTLLFLTPYCLCACHSLCLTSFFLCSLYRLFPPGSLPGFLPAWLETILPSTSSSVPSLEWGPLNICLMDYFFLILFPISIYLPFAFFLFPHPLPSDNHHSVVCVHESLFVFCLISSPFSPSPPTSTPLWQESVCFL